MKRLDVALFRHRLRKVRASAVQRIGEIDLRPTLATLAAFMRRAWRAATLIDSYAVEHADGETTTFVEASAFRLDRDGRIVFTRFPLVRVAAYQTGAWLRVTRGIAVEDLEWRRR